MKSIEQQIQELTEELRPVPRKKGKAIFWYYDPIIGVDQIVESKDYQPQMWLNALFASTNKAEVEDYADCYRRLRLYQLLGEKAAKEYPLVREGEITLNKLHGTDFIGAIYPNGALVTRRKHHRPCVLGGVWFAREEDRLKAIEICGIDRVMQEKMARFGIGGA